MRSLGVDVSANRGLDLVALDGSPEPAAVRRRVRPEDLPEVLGELRPEVVAIDSSSGWALTGGSRTAERELRRLGVQSYGTPSDPRRGDHTFYKWMTVGFRAFEAAGRAGYPRYRSGRARHTAMEVFPHASAAVLAGCLAPTGVPKKQWRTSILKGQGIQTESLRSLDQIDAALAALTGLLALQGVFTAVGNPQEGVIVLPARELPGSPFRRCTAAPQPQPQLRLPGLSPCACADPACREMTSREFAPGHDAKRKSLLWQQARRGEDALEELKRRKWELPPELR